MSEIYCPNCGTDITIDDGESYCSCPNCGTLLTDPDDSDFDTEATWFCDRCGACLNKQWGFDEDDTSWTCRECGYENSLSDDDIYESEADYEKAKEREAWSQKHWFLSAIASGITEGLSGDDDDEDEADEEDDDEEDEIGTSKSEPKQIKYKPAKNKKRSKAPKLTKKNEGGNTKKTFLDRVRRLFTFIGTLIVIAGIGVGALLFDAYANGIVIPVSISTLTYTNYETIETSLKDAGFWFVNSYPLDDLSYDNLKSENLVDRIEIYGYSAFSTEQGYSRFAPISVYYHSPGFASTPMGAKDAKGSDYQEVVNSFKNSGFGNIDVVYDYTLFFDPFNRYGTIEKISIDGRSGFKADERYHVNADVVITVYDIRKNAPEE